MFPLIDEFAKEAGISVAEAHYIFNAISSTIVSRIPVLEQVITDVFENTENDKLEKDINEMITILQEQQWKEKFKTWIIPPNIEKIRRPGSGGIF